MWNQSPDTPPGTAPSPSRGDHAPLADSATLPQSVGMFRDFMEFNPALTFIRNSEGRIVYVNAAYERFFRCSREELQGTELLEVVPPPVTERLQLIYQQVFDQDRPIEVEENIPDPDGVFHECRFYLFPIHGADGEQFLGGMAVDLSEQRSLERQLRQSQKMEAVGQLAGGIAHDMNNVLAVVNGYSELLLAGASHNDMTRAQLTEIRRAGERAAGLTRQLLALSRRQVLSPATLDLHLIIQELSGMLRRLIGEDIEVAIQAERSLGRVRTDRTQLEQVILNLAVNARDAMPCGGRIAFDLRNLQIDAGGHPDHSGVQPGAYVLLSVTDTGCGIPPEVQEHIFEPFFTTKEAGKGTGLGLATVFGIMQQSGGYVSVHSAVGTGTTFALYLPRLEPEPDDNPVENRPAPWLRGTETILLVEDEALVRNMVRAVLREQGYTVLLAETPVEALQRAAEHPGPIHLLLTDVVMPGMSGRELAQRFESHRPGAPVVFMSGYTDDAVMRHGILTADVDFLQKPFSPSSLSRKIREVLSRQSPPLPKHPGEAEAPREVHTGGEA